MNIKRFVFVLFFSILFIPKAWALTKGFEASSFHPVVDGGPYFTVYGSETHDKLQFTVGTTANYSYRPFQLIQNGRRVAGIINHELMQDVYASVGLINRWLQFGLDVPVAWWINFRDPTVAGATTQNKIAMGDIEFNFKSEFVDIQKHKVGLAFLPFIKLPTGSGKYYTGNGTVAGGGKFILEAIPLEYWRIALNIGALARKNYTFTNVDQTNQLLYGFASAIKITDYLSGAVEITGRTRFSGLFKEKEECPIEGHAGFKYNIRDTDVTLTWGGGAGIIRGSGAPTFRGFVGLSYRSPRQ